MNQDLASRSQGQNRLPPKTDTLFAGMAGTVYALDKRTGALLWKCPLRGAARVFILVEDTALFASTGGHIYRLDPVTGNLLWDNDMPGAGWGLATLVTAAQPNTSAQQVALLEEEAAQEGSRSGDAS